jgi:glucose-6-phosphate 1-dehydrogenase
VPNSAERRLIVQFNQPQKDLFAIQVQMQTPLGAFPQTADAMQLRPVGATRFAGYFRIVNEGAVRLEVENRRWRGVPFYLRSGKGLAERYSEVMIQFRCPSHLMFPLPPGEVLRCNHLTMVIQPNEGIRLNFQTKVPDVDGVSLRPRDLAFDYKRSYADKALPEAYERLLLDAMQGDASLFMRADEIERAWEIMDPIIAAAERADAPQPEEYAVGSAGPKCADALLAAEGRAWEPIG